jgi:lipopolysaccharide heptosyltransferase II
VTSERGALTAGRQASTGRSDASRAPFARPPAPLAPGWSERVRLAGLRAIGPRYARPKAAAAEPRSVLLIRPDHLGDMLFATPSYRLLREALPQTRITLLAGPWSQPVMAGNPDLDDLLICRFPGFERQPRTSSVAPYRLLRATARELAGRFDAALVLRFDHWWGAWLAAAAGIPRRIGYDRPETRPFLTDALAYQSDRHEVEQNSALVAALMTNSRERPGPLRFFIGEAARTWAADWRRTHGAADGRPLVAIHPGAGAAVKQWSAAAWAGVATRLAAEVGARILLTGGESERPIAAAIAAALPEPPLDASGQTNLNQLAALLELCVLALGSDSGPLHLAVAVGTPTVHLYGPVSATKFGPWGDPERHIVLRTDWPCAPCNRLDWPAAELMQHACMAAIAPDDVVRAAENVMHAA